MSFLGNLKPNIFTLECIGSSGAGKSEVAISPAASNARRILAKSIGPTNSTLIDHLYVYTTEYDDEIVIGAKLKESPLGSSDFSDIISLSLVEVVKELGKVFVFSADRDDEILESALHAEFEKRNNLKAVLSLLKDEQKNEFITQIVNLYHKVTKDDNKNFGFSYNIYNTVKNDLPDNIKENSSKFTAAIKQEIERNMDLLADKYKEKLVDIWVSINRSLVEIFHKYFPYENLSEDGYYFKEIFLNNPDEDFISAVFSANNLQIGQNLSLEALCDEMIIYVPMHEKLVEIITNNEKTNKVFRNSYNDLVFGILDTRGLYHGDNTDSENLDFCSDLLYRTNINAIVMVVPLEGDTNSKKMEELYRNALKDFYRQMPVFALHNKLDLLVSSWFKSSYNDDPLSIEEKRMDNIVSISDGINNIDVTEFELRDYIKNIIDVFDTNIKEIQAKSKKKSIPIKSLVCYLKRDMSFPSYLIKDYNILEAFKTILEDMADSLAESANKLAFTCDCEPTPYIDKKKLKELIHIHITDRNTDKRVFTPGMSNIAENLGITPHGNSYRALLRRLKNGDGYNANINDNYFNDAKSFSVNFTANLRNFASSEFIHSVIWQTLDIENVKSFMKNKEAYFNIVESYVEPKKLVSFLLYDNAVKRGEMYAFSPKSKFQNFLQNSMDYFNLLMIDEEQYTEAVELIVLDAAQKALDLNVVFQ